MKYKIVKENKPTLKNFGRYKAVADHPQGEVDTASIIDEVGKLNGVMPGAQAVWYREKLKNNDLLG